MSSSALIINKKMYRPGCNAKGRALSDRPRPEMENAVFAATNQHFKECCAAAGVQNTKRQASKFRRKMGAAFKASR